MNLDGLGRRITRLEASTPIPSSQAVLEALITDLPTPVLHLLRAGSGAREQGQPLNAAQEAAAAQFERAARAAGI